MILQTTCQHRSELCHVYCCLASRLSALPRSTGAILELASAFARVWTKLDAYYANEQFLPFGGQLAQSLYQFLLINYGQEAIALANCRDCLCNGRNILASFCISAVLSDIQNCRRPVHSSNSDTKHDSARIVRRMLKILDTQFGIVFSSKVVRPTANCRVYYLHWITTFEISFLGITDTNHAQQLNCRILPTPDCAFAISFLGSSDTNYSTACCRILLSTLKITFEYFLSSLDTNHYSLQHRVRKLKHLLHWEIYFLKNISHAKFGRDGGIKIGCTFHCRADGQPTMELLKKQTAIMVSVWQKTTSTSR